MTATRRAAASIFALTAWCWSWGCATEAAAAEYELGPGDLIELRVFPDDTMNRRLRVRPDGTAELPLVGAFPLAGSSAVEAAAAVARVLTGAYYRSPQVEIEVVEHVAHRAYVLGAVHQPGAYAVQRGERLLDLVQRAGGPAPTASGHAVMFRGAAPDAGGTRVSLTRLLAGGDLSQNVPVPDEATLYVFGRDEVYVLGEVRNPGAFPAGDRVTLLRAVSLAGGLAARADDDHVVVTDAQGGGRREYDLDRLLDGREDDPRLMPGDLVYVPSGMF